MITNAADALVWVSRSPELSLILKATLVLALGLVVARLARGTRASIRHVVLASALAALAVLPLAAAMDVAIPIEVPVASPAERVTADAVREAPAVGQTPMAAAPDSSWRAASGIDIPWLTIARVLWLGVAAWLLVDLGLTLFRLGRLRRTGLPWNELRGVTTSLARDAGISRPVDVVMHEEVAAPITFGTRHPVIVLPPDAREWPEADLRRAIVHELEHVRRADWALQTAARAACAMWWFHPLAWAAWRRLSLEAERACDDAVVAREEGTDYADQLVTLAARLSAANAQPTLGMANRSDLSARVSALLDRAQRRGRPGAVAVAAAGIAAAALVIAVAPLRAVAGTRSVENSIEASTATASQSAAGLALGRALSEAAHDGDIDTVRELLAAGAGVNVAVPGDGSPLIGAVRSGRPDIVSLLLDRGADPDLAVPGDGSALIAAARTGRADIATTLLDRGANVDLAVIGDENALIAAATEGHLDVVRLLVARGADVNARVRSGTQLYGGEEWRTALGMARRGGHDDVVAFLRANGARDDGGR